MTNARKKFYFMAKNNEKKTFKIVAWIQKIKKIKVVVHCMLDVQTKVQITSKTKHHMATKRKDNIDTKTKCLLT